DDCGACARLAGEVTHKFVARLPAIRALLGRDLTAAYEGDPAATSPNEAVFCCPGFNAITNHRTAHELHLLGAPLLPRIIAHSVPPESRITQAQARTTLFEGGSGI